MAVHHTKHDPRCLPVGSPRVFEEEEVVINIPSEDVYPYPQIVAEGCVSELSLVTFDLIEW